MKKLGPTVRGPVPVAGKPAPVETPTAAPSRPAVEAKPALPSTFTASVATVKPAVNLARTPLDTRALPTLGVVGLGITGATVLATGIANGWRGIGVELRPTPTRAAGFNTREELLHQFAKIDQLMEQRYPGMQTMKLAEALREVLVPVKVIEDVDARGDRSVTTRAAPVEVTALKPDQRVTNYDAMLGGGTPWQIHSTDFENVLRRYLAHLEESDRANGIDPPRVTLHIGARPVVPTSGVDETTLPLEERGVFRADDGSVRLSIEQVERKGRGATERKTGTVPTELGALDLLVLAEGTNSPTAERLGHRTTEVTYTDLPGFEGQPTVAKKRVLSGRLDVPIGPLLRNRVATVHDDDGTPYWVRQQVVGGKPEHGAWLLIEVPPGKTFDPIAEGAVPANTDPASAEYRQAAQALTKSYFLEQAAVILERTPESLATAQVTNGPSEFTLTERMSEQVVLAPNVIVAGDRVGNGFFGYGGAMTGAISHAEAFNTFFTQRREGVAAEKALSSLGDELLSATKAWVRLSKVQFEGPAPATFRGGAPGDRALPTIGALA